MLPCSIRVKESSPLLRLRYRLICYFEFLSVSILLNCRKDIFLCIIQFQ